MARGADLAQGEVITLLASTVVGATAGTNGTAVYIAGERVVYTFILAVTAAASEVTDTLDVYIDWSLDDTTYYNGAHFTQVLGNGGAQAFYVRFSVGETSTTDIDIGADQAVSTCLPSMFGPYVRARWVEVDGGGVASSFTFSVLGYAL